MYAGQLHDAIYLYALALNRTLTAHPTAAVNDGALIVDYAPGEFTGEIYEVLSYVAAFVRTESDCQKK